MDVWLFNAIVVWVCVALALAFCLRELRARQDQRRYHATFDKLREGLKATMEEVKRVRVDVLVLKSMLQDKGTFSAGEFSSSRQRFLKNIQQSMQEHSSSSGSESDEEPDKRNLLH